MVCGATEFCAQSACASCSPAPIGSPLPQSVVSTTVGQPNRFATSCAYGNAPDAYFSFVAPAAGTYTFDTLGSSFDTVMEARAGGCAGPVLGCDNNGGGGTSSKLVLTLSAQQAIVIIVDGTSWAQGPFTLNVH